MTITGQDRIRWHDKDVILLTGAREKPKGDWADYQPRQCRLVLDAATLWPYRLEWWGPTAGAPGDVRVMQIEFRNPTPNHPVDEATFTFNPPAPDANEPTARPRRNRLAVELPTP